MEADNRGSGRRFLLLALALPTFATALIGARSVLVGSHHVDAPVARPSPRAGAGFVADPAHGVVVLFGGRGLGQDLDDTWTWDGTTWTRQDPPDHPPAQEDAQLVYDGTRHRVLLLGGFMRLGRNELDAVKEPWSWDGHTWHVDPAAALPFEAGTYDHHLVTWDPAHRNVLLVASTVVVSAHPVPAPQTDGTFVPTRLPPNGAPSVWNSPPTGMSVPTEVHTDMHTWTWDGTTWTNRGVVSYPGGVNITLIAADAASGDVDVLGVQRPPPCPMSLLGDPPLWSAPFAYTRPRPEPLQPGCLSPIALPESRCSGTGTDLGTGQWTWDGASWRQLAALGLPCGFGGEQLVSDPSTGHLLLRSGGYTLNWDGHAWRQAHLVASFDGRTGAAVATDPGHHRVLLFGGRRAGLEGDDLWFWDGREWAAHGGIPPPLPARTETVGLDRGPPLYKGRPAPA